MKKKFYASETKEAMQMFAATLNERDFRRYAAVEALKLEHGGIEYISRLLNIDPKKEIRQQEGTKASEDQIAAMREYRIGIFSKIEK